MNGLSDLLRQWKGVSMAPRLYSIIGRDNVMEGFEPDIIRPNEDYFTIRLCEMNLASSQGYFQSFVPMAILVSDFRYDTDRQIIPFLVDTKILGLTSHVEGEAIEFKNTRVAGPIPYLGDDVALFTGLFRLEVSNVAKSLFSLCESLVKTVDPCGLSQYLALAKTLGQSLPAVLGMDECQFRLGTRDVFTETQGAANQFRQNYIAYVNCDENTFSPGDLWIKDNRLLSGKTRETAMPVRSHDYCLMKIERSESRSDYTAFGFYALWKEAHNLVMENAFQKAQFKKIEFLQQINTCPDLTEAHKEDLIQLFHLKFDHLLNRQKAFQDAVGQGAASVIRGDRGGMARIKPRIDAESVEEQVTSSLQSSAVAADTLKLPSRVGDSLFNLKTTWKKIPLGDNPEAEFDPAEARANQEINQQLAALKESRQPGKPDPSGLMEAIVLATLNP